MKYVVTIEMPRVSKKKPAVPLIVPLAVSQEELTVVPSAVPSEELTVVPSAVPSTVSSEEHPHAHTKVTMKDILSIHAQKVESTIQDALIEQSVNIERVLEQSARSNYAVVNEVIEHRLSTHASEIDTYMRSTLSSHCEKMENEMKDIVAEAYTSTTVHNPSDLSTPSFLYGFIVGTVVNACSFGVYLYMHAKK